MRHALPLALVLLACALMACGGPPREAQLTLTTTARALVAADVETAPKYSAHADECLRDSDTRAEYDLCMDTWDRVADAIDTSMGALMTAQIALDTWERIGDGAAFYDAAACIVDAVGELTETLIAARVPVPEEFASLVSIARRFGGSCHRGQ